MIFVSKKTGLICELRIKSVCDKINDHYGIGDPIFMAGHNEKLPEGLTFENFCDEFEFIGFL